MSDTSGLPTISEAPSANESRIRVTKRKLDDAFHVLDSAVSHNDTSNQPPPPKRSNTIKSLYSTLAKYGIKAKEPTSFQGSEAALTKSTPNLTKILSRAASKTKSTFSFRFSSLSPSPAPLLPATAEYRPSSLPSFLSRLSTFKLTTYANKPPAIDAVAASKCGWTNDGKDRLVCGLCNASWVVAGRDGLNRDAANALVEKQRASLVEAHKNGCPWKTRQCDDSIYCIPLQAPGAMIREIKARASVMNPVIKDVLLKHPLTATQLNALRSAISSYTPPDLPSSTSADTSMNVDEEDPSETALLASLFGWSLVSQPTAKTLRRVSASTRAGSIASSAPPTPPLSRASSVSLPRTPPRKSTAGPSASSSAVPAPTAASVSAPPARPSSEFTFRVPSSIIHRPDNALLQCELCQRRIGLWAFTSRPLTQAAPTSATNEGDPSTTSSPPGQDAGQNGPPATPARAPSTSPIIIPSTPTSTSATARPTKPLPQRAFDLLKEHRSYCPYTVRSTIVPSFPAQSGGGGGTPGAPSRASFIFKSGATAPSHSHSHSHSSSASGQTVMGALARAGSIVSGPGAPGLGSGSSVAGVGTPGGMEGWRAVLSVVLRYGMAERQRMEYGFLNGSNAATGGQGANGAEGSGQDGRVGEEDGMDVDVDNVKAMVSGVKASGGKDLLKYVKGLLG